MDFADPAPMQTNSKPKRKPRVKYTVYTQYASIGHYASISGNEMARKKFLSDFFNLTERSLKRVSSEKKKMKNLPTLNLLLNSLALMLDLDSNLIKFFHGV